MGARSLVCLVRKTSAKKYRFSTIQNDGASSQRWFHPHYRNVSWAYCLYVSECARAESKSFPLLVTGGIIIFGSSSVPRFYFSISVKDDSFGFVIFCRKLHFIEGLIIFDKLSCADDIIFGEACVSLNFIHYGRWEAD